MAFYTRTGYFKTFIEKRGVILSSGKLALESKAAVPFAKDVITDLAPKMGGAKRTYNFLNPCPKIDTRIALYSALTKKPFDIADYTATIEEFKYTVVPSAETVEKEGRAFANSLVQIVKDKDAAALYLATAEYDGNILIGILAKVFDDADSEDIALVTTRYTSFIASDFPHALSLETFNGHYKLFKEILSSMPTQKPEAEIVATLKQWMRSDADIQSKYYTLTLIHDKKDDLDENLAQIRKLLLSIKTTAKIDEIRSGKHTSLVAVKEKEPLATQSPNLPNTALVAITAAMALTNPKKRSKAVLAALIANGVDPVKNLKAGKGKDKSKDGDVVVPRLADGSISHYVKGMQLCKCKGKGSPTNVNDGGAHLFRDCTESGTKAPDRAADHKSNVVTLREDMTQEERDAALNGFFDHISNATVLLDPTEQVAVDYHVALAAEELHSADVSDLARGLGVSDTLALAIHAEATAALLPPTAKDSTLTNYSYASISRRAHTKESGPMNHFTLTGQVSADQDDVDDDKCDTCSDDEADSRLAALESELARLRLKGQIADEARVQAVKAASVAESELACLRVQAQIADEAREQAAKDRMAAPPPGPPLEEPTVELDINSIARKIIEDTNEHREGAAIVFKIDDSKPHDGDSASLIASNVDSPVEAGRAPGVGPVDIPAPVLDIPVPVLDVPSGRVEGGESHVKLSTPTIKLEGALESYATPAIPTEHGNEMPGVDDFHLALSTAKQASLKLIQLGASKIKTSASGFMEAHSGTIIMTLVILLGIATSIILLAAAPASVPAPPMDHQSIISIRGGLDLVPSADYKPYSSEAHELVNDTMRSHTRWRGDPPSAWHSLSYFFAATFTLLGSISSMVIIWSLISVMAVLLAPISATTSVAYAISLPVLAVLPCSFPRRVNAAYNPIKHVTQALNKTQRTLPLLVGAILIASAFLTSPTSAPQAAPPSLVSDSASALTPHLFKGGVLQPSEHVNLPFTAWLGTNSNASTIVAPRVAAAHNLLEDICSRSSLENISGSALSALTASLLGHQRVNQVSLPTKFIAEKAKESKKRTYAETNNIPIANLITDSGASASSVTDCRWLTNTRPCSEIFGDANGHVTQATMIGDLPIITRTKGPESKNIDFTLTNVRCVPKFKYSLISVIQIWDEQRIDARWRDLRHLELPDSAGGHLLGFDPDYQLSTITAVPGALFQVGKRDLLKEVQATCATYTAEAQQRQRAAAGPPPLPPVDQKSLVGYHRIGSTAHVYNMSTASASAFMHRRLHIGTRKLRSLVNVCRGVPSNLSSAVDTTCVHCALSRSTKASHSNHFDTPAPEPGVLHVDLKGPFPLSIGGYKYCMFFTDEHTRYVWCELLKTKEKSEQILAVDKVRAAFNALVYTPVDDEGKPSGPRPTVREIRSDHEGALESYAFEAFRVKQGIESSMSPPNDHDLNGIAERVNRTIPEIATASLLLAGGTQGFWPWFIRHAVAVHNRVECSVGTSTADANISPFQRFTLNVPKIMQLAPPGCAAVVRIPIASKTGLQPRGVEGILLGESYNSVDSHDVWIQSENKIMTSKAVDVDEDTYPWRGADAHQPLPAKPPAPSPLRPLVPEASPAAETDTAVWSKPDSVNAPHRARVLTFLNLFSGPYARAGGVAVKLAERGWDKVLQIDNDVERGGGHAHDLMNDKTYDTLLQKAKAGGFDTLLIAFPCTTFSAARFFDASLNDPTKPRGPKPVNTATYPDGLPPDQIEPGHHKELANSKLLLKRTVNLALAAHNSSSNATIILENPADKSLEDSIAYQEDCKDHGSIFATSEFKRLRDGIGLDRSSSCTFAYCMLEDKPKYQKYTTLFYTNDAAPILDQLNSPEFKCNHPRGAHEPVGGYSRAHNANEAIDGKSTWASSDASPYPDRLNTFIADAATLARTGSSSPREQVAPHPETKTVRFEAPSTAQEVVAPKTDHSDTSTRAAPPPPTTPYEAARGSPIAFQGFGSTPAPSPAPSTSRLVPSTPYSAADSMAARPPSATIQDKSTRLSRSSTKANTEASNELATQRARAYASRLAARGLAEPPSSPMQPITEEPDPSYSSFTGSPQWATVAQHGNASIDVNMMEECVADLVFDSDMGRKSRLEPVSEWLNTSLGVESLGTSAQRVDHDTFVIEVNVGDDSTQEQLALLAQAIGADEHDVQTQYQTALLSAATSKSMSVLDFMPLHQALRADSAGAPSSHKQVVEMGEPWPSAEIKELKNHETLGSFEKMSRDDLPRGRRVHRLVWVYKLKRDGTAKARLCVQGCTLEGGVDYDQTFASALKYSSARSIFALAAREGCSVRSIDFVAAYLQGEFMEGEVVYVRMPDGHEEYDSKGKALILKVVKPVYGIQQSGRRLQRKVIPWMESCGLRQLDDSDNCVWVYDDPKGKETFTMGVYVDNLQIAHSAELDSNGDAVDKDSFYHTFITKLRKDWDIVDEGEMVDLLGIQIKYNDDGSIKLYQEQYIDAMLTRFYPRGLPQSVNRSSLPFTSKIREHIIEALDINEHECIYPELVQPFQQRLGSLMYCCTATRVDIAYSVHLLCRCMSKPTPDLMMEVDYIFAYLKRHKTVGLTYDSKTSSLVGYSDASWEVRNSTSGWLCMWQSAPLAWGSNRQKSVALSSCEAEIVALSEATKDMVYFRKLLKGLNTSYITGPNDLSTDNQAARDLSYNPERHDKTKHIERRHFYIRDMVEALELRVPLVGTKDNWSDFLTKPLDSKTFFALRAHIMNEPRAFNPSAGSPTSAAAP